MPAMTYPPGTPDDSKWKWYVQVPEQYENLKPDWLVRWARHAMAFYNLTQNGNPPEVSIYPMNGNLYWLTNSDVDPSGVIVIANVPPLPQTPEEARRARMVSARNTLANNVLLTNVQLQTVMKDVLDLLLADGS